MAGIPGANTEYTIVVAPVCPLGTPASSPLSTAVPGLDNTFLWTMNVKIPAGHAGYTGIALVDSGQFILPQTGGTSPWLIGDDDDLTFAYGQALGATVSLQYYNTSTDFPHGWQVRLTFSYTSGLVTGGDVIVTPSGAGIAQAIEATTGG